MNLLVQSAGNRPEGLKKYFRVLLSGEETHNGHGRAVINDQTNCSRAKIVLVLKMLQIQKLKTSIKQMTGNKNVNKAILFNYSPAGILNGRMQ